MKHHSLLVHPSTNKIFGDELLHKKKTTHNFFRQNEQVSKFYERLNPNAKKVDSSDLYNPEKSRVAIGLQETKSYG